MSGANKRVVPPAPSGGIVGKKATMKRLKGFDYKKPYFYMVTLKRLAGLFGLFADYRGGRAAEGCEGSAMLSDCQ